MKKFNTNIWNRKAQYEFFKNYKDPFFNITVNIDVTQLVRFCKANQLSFTWANYYYVMKAMEEIPEFKLRFFENEVYEFEEIRLGSTTLNEDKTFSFCYFHMTESVDEFVIKTNKTIENHKLGNAVLEDNRNDLAVVHGTTLPWLSFTSLKHPRNGNEGNKGIPKLAFGKIFKEGNSEKIPFSIEVHHALMDGYHIGRLVELYQDRLNQL
ncbi:MAG TPA: hypothetical protein EYG92_08430 [Lutibacter sp.]|nr:hypothetical protein [Lutibacter sp.]